MPILRQSAFFAASSAAAALRVQVLRKTPKDPYRRTFGKFGTGANRPFDLLVSSRGWRAPKSRKVGPVSNQRTQSNPTQSKQSRNSIITRSLLSPH